MVFTATIPRTPCYMSAADSLLVIPMSDRQLRALRNEAHHYFDQLYKRGHMSKEDAYQWLASILAAPMGQAHIGLLGEYYCRQVIEESKKVLNSRKNTVTAV